MCAGWREDGTVRRETLCGAEVWCEFLKRDPAEFDRRASQEMAAILRQLPGWRRYTGTTNGTSYVSGYGRYICYERIPGWAPPEDRPGAEAEDIPF